MANTKKGAARATTTRKTAPGQAQDTPAAALPIANAEPQYIALPGAYVGETRLTFRARIDEGEIADTQVFIEDTRLAWIDGNQAANFARDLREVIERYRR